MVTIPSVSQSSPKPNRVSRAHHADRARPLCFAARATFLRAVAVVLIAVILSPLLGCGLTPSEKAIISQQAAYSNSLHADAKAEPVKPWSKGDGLPQWVKTALEAQARSWSALDAQANGAQPAVAVPTVEVTP